MHFRGPTVEKLDQKYAIGPLKCILQLAQYLLVTLGSHRKD